MPDARRVASALLAVGIAGCTEGDVQYYGFLGFVLLMLISGAVWLWQRR
jgi:hypothetical protein